MKRHDYYKCAGQTITRLYTDWNNPPEEVEIEVPGEGFMAQFDLGDWWVMYPYGDDRLSKKLRKRLFGKIPTWTVAVNRRDGRLATAHYFTEPDDLHGTFHCFYIDRESLEGYRLPPHYVHRIDELRGLKRPYSIHINPYLLDQFIDREIGYSDLPAGVVIQLRFGRYSGRGILEVEGDHYREVSAWGDLTVLEEAAKVTDKDRAQLDQYLSDEGS